MTSESNHTGALATALAFLAAASVTGLFLWVGGLAPDNDALYADVARGMLRSGDWLNPQIHGVPFLDKPPLYFWLLGALEALLGDPVWVLRLPAALCGALGVALVYRAAARQSLLTGILAALSLLSVPLYFEYARRVYMEVPVACAVFAASLAFARAAEGLERNELDRAAFVWAGALTGVGFMLKSLVGLFGAIGFAVWVLATLRARVLSRNVILGGLIALGALVLVAAPWHVVQLLTQRDVFLEFTWKLHVEDQLLAAQPWSTGPFWFYLQLLVTDAPLLGLCLAAGLVLSAREQRAGNLPTLDAVLALTCLSTLLILSASETKKDLYLIPLAPPAAALSARCLLRALPSPSLQKLLLAVVALGSVRLWPLLDPGGEFLRGAVLTAPAGYAARDHSGADETIHVLDIYFANLQYYAERRALSEWTSPTPPQMTGHIPYIHYGQNMRYVAPEQLPARLGAGDVWILPRPAAQQLLPQLPGARVLHEDPYLFVVRAGPARP